MLSLSVEQLDDPMLREENCSCWRRKRVVAAAPMKLGSWVRRNAIHHGKKRNVVTLSLSKLGLIGIENITN